MVATRSIRTVACAVAVAATWPAQAILVAQNGCSSQDLQRRSSLFAKMAVFDAKCEEMCRAVGAYPKCDCPGFQGNPPSSGDMRKCMEQYCQDPSDPCPTDGFVNCVKASTEVSALQWDSLLQRFDTSLSLYSGMVRRAEATKASAGGASCEEKSFDHEALLQAKIAALDVKCEEMCKKLGEYPKCQCPGFEGNPPSDGDTRKCMDKYCKDPSTPCPSEGFVTCVKEATKVSALQWDSLFERLGTTLDLYKTTVVAARGNATMGHP